MGQPLSRRFQRLILPNPEKFKAEFPNSFVYYQPKEEVGGDFYWYFRNGSVVVVAADCTGHGVTGAFVHILGHAFLNEIVETHGQTNPASVLTDLDKRMKSTAQLKELVSDEVDTLGMDMAILRINLEHTEMDFCGANMPCYVVRNGQMIVLEKIKRGIGSALRSDEKFIAKNFALKRGDTIYLASDGYQDQFGGNRDKKLGSVRFQELLVETAEKPMGEQRAHIRKFFDDWRDGEEQTDDVMVVGIQI